MVAGARAMVRSGGAATLTNVSGTLASPFTVTGALQTFMTTPALAVGTYKVTMKGSGGAPAVNVVGPDVKIAAGTATASFAGPTADGIAPPVGTAAFQGPLVIDCIATVTVAGTLIFQCQGGGSIFSATPNEAFAGATGFDIVKIG